MTTELLSFFNCITEFTGYFLCISLFFNFNLKRTLPLCYGIITFLWSFISFTSNRVFIMLTPIIGIIILFFTVPKSYKKKYMTISVLSICVSDFLQSLVSIIICLHWDYEIFFYDSYNTLAYLPKLVTLILIATFTFLLCKLQQLNNFNFVDFEIYQIISLIIGIVCCDILIASNISLSYNHKDYKGILISIAIIFLHTIYVFSCFWFTYIQCKNLQLKNMEIQYQYILKSQKLYFENIIKKNQETKKYRHDLHAHLLAMQAIAEESNNKEMLTYLEKMIKPISKHSVSYTGNFVLDSIINELKTTMDENEISFEYNGILHLRENIVIFDMCSLIYNSLLNAIEGCNRLENTPKRIIMEVETNHQNQKIRIHVYNTCIYNKNAQNIDILNSSKPDRAAHGIGMKNMRDTVQKYNGYIQFFIESSWFHMQAIV